MTVCLLVWNWVKFETFWKLNEREWNDFPKLSPCIYDLHEFIFISSQNPRVKMIWLLPFKLNERVFENNWISFGNISIHKLHATQWFSWEKIKWLLQNVWNMSWKFKRIKLKVLLKLLWNQFQFGVIWFLFKLFFSKNKIYGN